jgi:hypothetical protein
MQSRRVPGAWPRAAVPEVGLVISKWTAARTGAIASLWPAAPRWLGRYVAGMLSAYGSDHHLTSGGRLMR